MVFMTALPISPMMLLTMFMIPLYHVMAHGLGHFLPQLQQKTLHMMIVFAAVAYLPVHQVTAL